jgi:hypothetical protein
MAEDIINLPPCPDCGAAVEDIHQSERLEMKLYRSMRPAAVMPDREIELLPCRCRVWEFTLVTIEGKQRIVELQMESGWRWKREWEPLPHHRLAVAAARLAESPWPKTALPPGQEGD